MLFVLMMLRMLLLVLRELKDWLQVILLNEFKVQKWDFWVRFMRWCWEGDERYLVLMRLRRVEMVLLMVGLKLFWFLLENYFCQCCFYLKGWREFMVGRICFNFLVFSFGFFIERRLFVFGIICVRRYQLFFLYFDCVLVMWQMELMLLMIILFGVIWMIGLYFLVRVCMFLQILQLMKLWVSQREVYFVRKGLGI